MSRAGLLSLLAVSASACTLVIGTTTRTLSIDGGDDVTVPEASDDTGSSDGGPSDVVFVPDVPVCAVTGCLVEAGVCGTSCGVASQTCQTNCKGNQNCKNQCIATETACRNSCAANCNACTLGGGCQDPVGCADASAM